MRLMLPMHVTSPWSRGAARLLADSGHAVHVFDFVIPQDGFLGYFGGGMLRPDLGELQDGVRLHQSRPLHPSKWRYLLAAPAFRRLCRRESIDLVLVLGCGGFAAMTYASGFRPYAVMATGSDVLLARGPTRRINRHILRRAAAVFANGEYLRDRTSDLAGRPDVASICLGTDLERFAPPAARPAPPTMICTRGFLPVYNNEYIIEGLARLPEEVGFDQVVFTSSGPTLESVRRRAASVLPPTVYRRLQFLGGVDATDLLHHLQRAGIFVSMSRSDGTSISLLEALACGLFPVVSDIPPNREWIDSRKRNGLLVPLDRPEALAAALEQALADAEGRRRAAEINRRLVATRADGRANMRRLAARLEQALGKG